MALIKCPECGSKISDKSEVCIKCGCPLKKAKSNKNSKNKKFIVIALISVATIVGVVGGILLLSNSNDDIVDKPVVSSSISTEKPTEVPTEEPTLSWKEKWINEHIALAIDAVEDDLLNRDSLQLRKVLGQIHTHYDNGNEIPDDEKAIDIVVDFSAENKFGGYTPMKCIVYFEDSEPEIHYEDEGKPFDLNWLINMVEEQEHTETYEYFEYDGEEVEFMLEQQN